MDKGNLNVTNARITGDLLIMQFGKGTENTAKNIVETVNKMKSLKKQLILTINQYRKKRSLTANGYMWLLCQKLAEKIGLLTKEEVYQKAVKDVGQFETASIKEEAIFKLRRFWNDKGLGWFIDTAGESDRRGFVDVIMYFGSSAYDSREMSILVDYIVEQCKEQGIETMPPEELKSLCDKWRPKVA